MMRRSCYDALMRLVVVCWIILCAKSLAQTHFTEETRSDSRPNTQMPQGGVAWYSTWGTALAEAKRSQRPIFFIATPFQRTEISGIFSAPHARVQAELFTTSEFIALSRKFVCVRLATFENQEHLNMVHFLLNKSPSLPPHSAFTVFTPDGKTQLLDARASLLNLRDELPAQKKALFLELAEIAQNHPSQALAKDAVMEDFHSVAQALRSSAADQRLLFFIVAPQGNRMPFWKKAQAIINDPEVLGKIHVDFIGASDSQWHRVIERDSMQAGYFIIKPTAFGRGGRMMAELPLRTPLEKIKLALLKAHQLDQQGPRRNDTEHLQRGKELGISFQSTIPFPSPEP